METRIHKSWAETYKARQAGYLKRLDMEVETRHMSQAERERKSIRNRTKTKIVVPLIKVVEFSQAAVKKMIK